MKLVNGSLENAIDQINGQCDCACLTGEERKAFIAPIAVYLELTDVCNNLCQGCPNSYSHLDQRKKTLRYDEWKRIIEQLHPFLKRVKLTGGEPTLHPDFERILILLGENGIKFDLLTNGRWIHPEKIINILLRQDYFGGCLVSLHGYSPKTHEVVTGVPGSFSQTIENIKKMVSNGIEVVLSTIITNQNYRDIQQIIDLGVALGVSSFVFNRHVGSFLAITPSALELLKAVEFIEEKRKLGALVKFSVTIPQCFAKTSSLGCLAGIATCTVDPWGNVRPCNHAPVTCGNLLSQTITDIWASDSMKSWREIPENCLGCSLLNKCGGGCKAQSMISFQKQDPLLTKTSSIVFDTALTNILNS